VNNTTNLSTTIDLSKTQECVFVVTNFHMGIGKMKQIRNLDVVTDADKSKLRHQKQLIDSPELEEIRSQDGKLRRYVESRTCRYSESMGFLPKVLLPELDRVMVAYQTVRRPKLVAAFMTKYREMEANNFAALRSTEGGLGEHFRREDYPSSDTVEAGFAFHFAYKPVGDLTGFEGISDVIIAREIEKEQSIRMQAVLEWRDAFRLAGQGALDQLFEALRPQSDGKRKKLYDTTVTKLQEYLETFQPRNLANDDEWDAQFVSKLREIMKGVTVDKLRESDTLKDHVAKQLDELKQNVGSLVQVSGRKFR
jgi:hypothetical protein